MPRPGLSREKIALAALKLADRDGLEALSMRKLADALGVGAMSLYNHVRDKAELESLLLEKAFEAMPPIVRSGAWQHRVTQAATALRDAFSKHPGLTPLLLRRTTVSTTALQPIEEILAGLDAGGFKGTELLRAYHVVLAYLTGFLLTDLTGALAITRNRTTADVAGAVLQLDNTRFPHLTAIAQVAARSRSSGEFEYGLAVVIKGLRPARGKT